MAINFQYGSVNRENFLNAEVRRGLTQRSAELSFILRAPLRSFALKNVWSRALTEPYWINFTLYGMSFLSASTQQLYHSVELNEDFPNISLITGQLFIWFCTFLYVEIQIKVINNMDAQEIKRAVEIHNSIEKVEKLTKCSLKTSPILLGLPTQTITLEIPASTKNSYEYVEQLYEDIGDHDLLFKAMRTGWSYIDSYCKMIPKSKKEYLQQLIRSHAFRVAKERGYSVSNNCFNKQFYHGEYEAYDAASEIIHGNALELILKKSEFDNSMHNYASWYNCVKLITSQFIVPHSGFRNKTPYIIDQLWVISHAKNRVRLLGLKIDSEQDGLNKAQESYLQELGYEMYHVASWWCRVDPYRVICEFLTISGILPGAIHYLIGSELNSIDEYKCGICSAPMVRWDWDWIQKCQIGNSTVLAHKSCVIDKENSCYY